MSAVLPHWRDEYRPMVSEETIREIATERVCTAEALSEFISLSCSSPSEREASEFFGPISNKALVEEILLQDRATDAQIAAGWRLLRSRFVADFAVEIAREMEWMRE